MVALPFSLYSLAARKKLDCPPLCTSMCQVVQMYAGIVTVNLCIYCNFVHILYSVREFSAILYRLKQANTPVFIIVFRLRDPFVKNISIQKNVNLSKASASEVCILEAQEDFNCER